MLYYLLAISASKEYFSCNPDWTVEQDSSVGRAWVYQWRLPGSMVRFLTKSLFSELRYIFCFELSIWRTWCPHSILANAPQEFINVYLCCLIIFQSRISVCGTQKWHFQAAGPFLHLWLLLFVSRFARLHVWHPLVPYGTLMLLFSSCLS